MKKALPVAIATLLSATTVHADLQPYIGLSANFFSINTDLTATGSGFFSSSSGVISDSGTAIGVTGGFLVDENSKIRFSYYSGEESDSSILTATVIRVSYDYIFNSRGAHKGWFLGGGISNVGIEFDQPDVVTSSNASATGLLLRFGYESMINANLVVEIAYNLNFAEVKQTNSSVPPGLVFDNVQDVDDLSVSLSYLF